MTPGMLNAMVFTECASRTPLCTRLGRAQGLGQTAIRSEPARTVRRLSRTAGSAAKEASTAAEVFTEAKPFVMEI